MAWSPSSTERFLACPMKWWLDRQGAIGRVRDESAMEQGTAFHAGMAAHWNNWDVAETIAEAVHGAPVPRMLFAPEVIEMERKANMAVERTIAQEGDALREQGVVCVECVLGGTDEERLRHGRYPGTADLVTQNDSGLSVCDYKTKMTLQPAYIDAELRQTQRSWQLKQYSWFVQQKYNQPVTQVRKLLVAFKPTLRVWLATYPVTQQQLSDWYTQAETIWGYMDEVADNGSAWQNADACERYGWQHRCEFSEVCWDGKPIEYKESVQ